MPDQLSALYSEFLEGGYDCVDRVVLNAYFSMGQSGGGFRVWWRELYGSDEDLDDNHLMRMAGRFSRRLRAWAKANGVPVIYCSPGDDKHKMGEQHLATREEKCGLFLVLVSKAPALVWEAQQTGTGKLGQLVPKDPWPYVNHYSFHILDPDWGHVTIKMSGHPPFGAQVILNGHEYVAAQARKAEVEFTKHENCFTAVSNATGLAKIADTLSQDETAGRLRQLCERWIYSVCLCFALDLEEQEKSRFQYQYSVFQMEYSRNLLFRSGRQMEEIFQALIDRTRAPLDLDRIKTIFGDKSRPHRDTRKKNPTRWGVVVETPTYDLTVFKVHYGKMDLTPILRQPVKTQLIFFCIEWRIESWDCHAGSSPKSSNWPQCGGWSRGYPSAKQHAHWRSTPTCCNAGAGSFAMGQATSFPGMGSSAGRMAGSRSWSARSANRRWRSIF